jgi:hypothetical protein
MTSFQSLSRAAAGVAFCGSVVGILASMAPVDEFVASGEYAQARAAAADCSELFIPALEASGPSERSGLLRFAAFRPVGSELSSIYRSVDLSAPAAVLRYEDYGGSAEGVSVVSYETPDNAITTTSYNDGVNCTRVTVRTETPKVQVRLLESNLSTTSRYLPLSGRISPPSGVRVAAVPGGTAKMIVQVVVNGEPGRNLRDGFICILPSGPPGRYGRTLGHEHHASTVLPLIQRIAENRFVPSDCDNLKPSFSMPGVRRGARARLNTDQDGINRFDIVAGTKGGPETVVAGVSVGGQWVVGLRVVIAHAGEAETFPESVGMNGARVPASDDFPFLLTGWKPEHNFNHWTIGNGRQFASILKSIWERDEGRIRGGGKWIPVNDASIEYGGAFHFRSGAACDKDHDPSTLRSHVTHAAGTDLDFNPCYTQGENGRTVVSGRQCELNPGYVRMNERLLAAEVIGRHGGAIKLHCEFGAGCDGVPMHYHTRLPRGVQ